MWMAKAKQATTIANQRALAILDLAVEMCTRPWIVELSKNSLKAIDAILDIINIFDKYKTVCLLNMQLEVSA